MLLEKIKNDPELSKFIKDKCEENGICVSIDPSIKPEDYLIIKVDDFYNSLGLNPTPPAADCIVLQTCSKNEYSLTIVELKNINETRRITAANIEEKFKTCFLDFMENRFKHYFYNNRHYCKVKLYFVSKIDIYGKENINNSIKLRLIREAKIKFKNKTYFIEPKMPTPMIKPC